MKTVKELNQFLATEGASVVLTDTMKPNEILASLLSLNSKNVDIMSTIVELSSDSKNIGQATINGTPYKGNSIDSSGICHNINANEILIKNILFVPLKEYLAQQKVLAVADATETEKKRGETAHIMRQKIASDTIKRIDKIVSENPDAYALLVSYVYTSVTAMGKSVTKLFINTSPFFDGDELIISTNKKYRVIKSEVNAKKLSINADFAAKHLAKWGCPTTSNYSFLQFSRIENI